MIYTVTLNPAIDLVIVTKKLEPKVVNRTEKFELQPNGKGVNVSFILKKLGIDSVATGIGGGFTLDYVISGLAEKGIKTNFLKVKEPTRVNVFTDVLDEGTEYKQVNPGPVVSSDKQDQFLDYLESTVTKDDMVVVSGSFSRGIKPDFLVKLAQLVQKQGAKFVIDSSYLEVIDTLKYRPFLLKPNDSELAAFFNYEGEMTAAKTVELAQKLIKLGCQNVLVSLGADGAAFINKYHVLFANAPQIQVVNSACAGDTMLGTFIAFLEKNKPVSAALKMAVAAGSDTASRTGLTDFSLDELLPQISVEERMK
ncbi:MULTISPECIES: 1-phosphofructokinase [Lactobacillus]|uniref:Tagatose-6-phosphate kinase n=1 Tax=Lactobacillus melliventris TaxID=1218507 RepID=A0ABX5MYS9_9LACO|nr:MULTISPECIES: 1-phosphofructokinase [Lactobacillus]MBH9990253.1 1-phosphofructokinase [Lactobacillus sp. M0392]MBI0024651.1 1-phosphofructokinase [Lactobacillus sp. W8171]MBI0045301.1 1-phosphofructokinase [Lactobacillus sp. M0393]PXY84020.1 1-phosphofructokinase [Lactobacillus melliventris]